MGFSQHRHVHFLKGVPGWSWTTFLIDFKGVWGGLGGPLETTFGRLWQTLGTLWAPGGSLWATLGVLGIILGAFRVTLGSLGVPLGAFLRMGVTLCVI